jgi:glycosyltransferase involved in cell wall biosynthesis
VSRLPDGRRKMVAVRPPGGKGWPLARRRSLQAAPVLGIRREHQGGSVARWRARYVPRVRVLVLAPYPQRSAPSQRFRFEQYIEPLRERGIELDVRPLLEEASQRIVHEPGRYVGKTLAVLKGAARRVHDIAAVKHYDLALIHREAFPLGPAWVERTIRAMGLPYIFDFDDAIYLPNSTDANRRLVWLKFPRKLERIVSGAALVTAGNSHLETWAQQYTRSTMVVPTTIDTSIYTSRIRLDPGGALCVGWSGSRTTIEHLRPLGPVLARLQRRHGVRLRVIGDPGFRMPGAQIEALPWSEDREIRDLSEIDIGVMPLPDDEWARGKCGLKALQYMALGIPTVMSPVGVNVEIAEGGAAELASASDDWEIKLERLILDSRARRELGAAGRQRVAERFATQVNVDTYETAIQFALGRA